MLYTILKQLKQLQERLIALIPCLSTDPEGKFLNILECLTGVGIDFLSVV